MSAPRVVQVHEGRVMTAALRRKCASIRALLAAANADEACTRHKVGQIILDVRRAERKYGTRAVAQIAAELGRDQATLYRYARVAECWDKAALRAVLRRLTAKGEPLSWSHLMEISTLDSGAAREQLVSRAIAEGLSVRDVARLVHGGEDAAVSASALDELRRLVAVTESLKGRAHWDMEMAALDNSPETLELIERAVSAQRELQELCVRNLARLRETHEQLALRLARVTPRVPALPRSHGGGRLLAGYGVS